MLGSCQMCFGLCASASPEMFVNVSAQLLRGDRPAVWLNWRERMQKLVWREPGAAEDFSIDDDDDYNNDNNTNNMPPI